MLEGLPPNNAAHLMRLHCDEATARIVSDIVTETFDPAETAASAFEDDPIRADWTPGAWTVEIYFGFVPDQAAIRALIRDVAGEEAADKLEFALIAQQDWVAASLAGLVPVRAGRFLVHGSHERGAIRTNDIAIEIEAALAFGTGHHGTTRGCLLALDRLHKQGRAHHVLDIGTGTGVLAMAAARLSKRPIIATDIDPIAVAAARENARLNGVAPYVRPVVARGTRHEAMRGKKFSLILANILARPLRLMAPGIRSIAAQNASLILSGLLAGDVPGVLAAYRAQGFSLVERRSYEGWSALVMRAGGAAPRPQHEPQS